MGVLIAVVLIFAALVFLLKPGSFSMSQLNMVYGVNFAHRGLHSKDKAVPENSLAAFEAAVENGYGMELDIQLSKDGEVVVFHDDDLPRVTGVEGRVDAYTYSELRQMRLCGTEHFIPLLTEVFEKVNGTAPIIIELKTGPRKTELCEKALKLMRAYEGPFCIESFDPRIVRWFYKNAPDILRGQLSDHPRSFENQPWILSFALGNLLTNVMCRPQFIAYGIGKKSLLARCAESLGGIKVCWTAREADNREKLEHENDGVIFEFYNPEKKYK